MCAVVVCPDMCAGVCTDMGLRLAIQAAGPRTSARPHRPQAQAQAQEQEQAQPHMLHRCQSRLLGRARHVIARCFAMHAIATRAVMSC